MRVEFRLLQIVLSPVSGDHVTAALVHWDGRHLRVASSPAAFGSVEPEHREGIRAAVEDVIRRANKRARDLEMHPALDIGLAHAFPVREGLGAALFWTPIVSRDTADPEAHFVELKKEIRLEYEPTHRVRRVSERRVFDGLVALGNSLKLEDIAGPWLRVQHQVAYKMPYEVPFSWKNGSWHHTVPLSLDRPDSRAIDDEIRRTYGLVDLSLPPSDVAVFVVVMPTTAIKCEQAERDLRMLRLTLKAKRPVDLVVPNRTGRTIDLQPLEKRVRTDLQSH